MMPSVFKILAFHVIIFPSLSKAQLFDSSLSVEWIDVPYDVSATNTSEPLSELQGVPTALNSNCYIDNFITGFGFDENSVQTGSFSIPPDPSGAAGMDRLVAVVNVMIEVRTKIGTVTFRDSLRDFFTSLNTAQTRLFDPKVVYDEHSGRFVVIALQREDTQLLSRMLLAVSKNEQPDSVSDWYFTAIDSALTINGNASWADYPGFEVDEEAVYITNNMFAFVGGAFQAVRLWIVNKGVVGGFYGGGAASVSAPLNPYQSAGFATTTMPAQVHGSGGVGTTIGTFLVSILRYTNGLVEVQVFTISNPLTSPSFALTVLSLGTIHSTSALPDAPQLGSSILIETNDGRALDAVWRSNTLWVTSTINPVASNPNTMQSTAHWIRIDTTGGNIALQAQGDLGGETFAAGAHTFFPAVAVNKRGEVAFGYSASAPTIYAGAFGSLLIGVNEVPFIVKCGIDSYVRQFSGPRNRWGDYSGISVDPTDDSFWIYNEFADTQGTIISGESGRWGTAWARVYCVNTKAPTKIPTKTPTKAPTKAPTKFPAKAPTPFPVGTTKAPTKLPVRAPTKLPVRAPTPFPIRTPTLFPVRIQCRGLFRRCESSSQCCQGLNCRRFFIFGRFCR